MLKKIISGSQTGVNRAALDVAIEKGIPCGGWCPNGRQAEDGVLNKKYPLEESKSTDDRIATELNIGESDGTLILTWGRPTGGTALSQIVAKRRFKHLFVVDIKKTYDDAKAAKEILKWIESCNIEVLNIVGPRESRCPGIYNDARSIIEKLIL